MFKNNLMIAWRNIKKSKAYSALNILGLAAGMAVFILIMLFVRTEISYDRYHANAPNIYRVIMDPGFTQMESNLWANTPAPLAPTLAQDLPEVQSAARIHFSSNVLISFGDKQFLEKQFCGADSQIFEIFTFPFVLGDRTTALQDPYSVALSEREARRLFGDEDPIGRTILYSIRSKSHEFKVTGVFRDIPANSHFVLDIVVPFETLAKIQGRDLAQWDDSYLYTYVLLKNGTDMRAMEHKLSTAIKKHGSEYTYALQSLTGIHLRSRINAEISPNGDARFVLLFASIAVLVLVIACLNYMNLATARSFKRVKEVGLRKVVGASKGGIVRQFLGESMGLTFIALILAMGLVLAVLPPFRTFVERELAFDPFRNVGLMSGLIFLAAVVGAVAGSYPAFFVSGFRPISALKGTGASRDKGRGFRNALIVFQFAASIALIICAVGVRSQLRYIRNADLGYERGPILVLSTPRSIRTNLEAFKTELKRDSAVLSVASSSNLPNNVDSTTSSDWLGKPDIRLNVLEADYDFVGLYGLKLAGGRSFSRDFPSDSGGAFLINEAAQKALDWDDPIGRDFFHRGNRDMAGKIVGVVKDFHLQSLHFPITPLYIYLNPNIRQYVSIKIRNENFSATIAFVKNTWERFAPEYPFEYSFFDDVFDQAYRIERRFGTIFNAFAGLAILIACLGLLGLASFAAEQKTKEIGIRKVLGASSTEIVAMFSREFIKWVVAANLIAWPIGFFAMRAWLQNFAYRTSLTVPMFLGAALAALAIAVVVISLQTYRAAAANPVDSLRHE